MGLVVAVVVVWVLEPAPLQVLVAEVETVLSFFAIQPMCPLFLPIRYRVC
jgi:hypothetical protein